MAFFRRLMSRMIIFFVPKEKRYCDRFASSRNVACSQYGFLIVVRKRREKCNLYPYNGGKKSCSARRFAKGMLSDIFVCEACDISFGIVSLIKSVFLIRAKAGKTFNYGKRKLMEAFLARVCVLPLAKPHIVLQ